MALAFIQPSPIEVESFSEQLPMVSLLSARSSRSHKSLTSSRAASDVPSFSFASCSSFDFDGFDVSQPCSSQGSLKIKNTFIHVDRESNESDDELAMPCKCASAPNIESCANIESWAMTPKSVIKSKRQAPRAAAETTPKADAARTPKVTFDLRPSFFGGTVDERRTIPDTSLTLESDGPLQVAELKASGPYEIKNTFIHLDKSQATDSDDCDLPTRSISGPALLGAFSPCRAIKASKDDPAYIVGSQMADWPSPRSDGTSSLGSRSLTVKNTFIHVDVDVDHCTEDDFGLMMPAKSNSQPELTREQDANITTTEGSRTLPSIGAVLHGSGQCKPCAWFWKPEGCKWGRECGHCHMCPVGELRRRKKEKQAETKELKALLRQQQAS